MDVSKMLDAKAKTDIRMETCLFHARGSSIDSNRVDVVVMYKHLYARTHIHEYCFICTYVHTCTDLYTCLIATKPIMSGARVNMEVLCLIFTCIADLLDPPSACTLHRFEVSMGGAPDNDFQQRFSY